MAPKELLPLAFSSPKVKSFYFSVSRLLITASVFYLVEIGIFVEFIRSSRGTSSSNESESSSSVGTLEQVPLD